MALLEVVRLYKTFGPHYALSDVHFDIMPGEVHGLVGENGAGKSTFIKIVTGVYAPDSGKLVWQGNPVAIPGPDAARRLGINVVHQDRHLIPSFTGYENLFLGLDYPRKAAGMRVDWKAMRSRAKRMAEEFGVALDMSKPAAHMSPPEKTMLEILRAMMLDCKLLILDEPTASLTDREAERLFMLIRQLTEQGTAVLYVSHRMEEILRLSDRITVFQNGRSMATVGRPEASKDRLITLMSSAGAMKSQALVKAVQVGEPLLEAKGLSTTDGKVRDIDLTVRQGEIVGLFGLAGSGRTELLETLYGLRDKAGGEVRFRGRRVAAASPRDSLDQGVVLIPEERKRDALVMDMTIRENMTLPVLKRFSGWWKMRRKAELAEARRWMEDLKVKAAGPEQTVGELSGGNQQKVVFARALLSSPVLFLCDEPTQAVDVMTREEIHRLLRDQADQGCGVLFVSSDLQEVLDISDRLYVLHGSRIAAELDNRDVTPEQVLAICYSQGKESELRHG
ncbi:MAG: D-ribose transporter ATP-binding protein [Cohnella sp.]|nr:D-ribose transporter ATP-binding protein [Cohnella sp.]